MNTLPDNKLTVTDDTANHHPPPVPLGPVDIRSTALLLLTVLALLFTLHWAQTVLLPLVLSVLVSYALYPVISTLKQYNVPRTLSALVLLTTLVGAIGYGSYHLQGQAEAMLDRIPVAVQQARQSLRARFHQGEEGVIEKVQEAAQELEKAASEAGGNTPPPPGVTRVQIQEPAFKMRDYVWGGSIGVLTLLGQLVTIIVLVFFFLVSGVTYKRKLVKIAGPTLSRKKIAVQIIDEFNYKIRRYLFVMFISSVFVGVFTWLPFLWLGVEQAALWGVIAGLASAIPYLGPAVVFGATAVAGLAQFGTLTMGLVIAFVTLFVTSIQGYVLTPWLASRATQINAPVVFIGLLFWGWLWGPIGLLVATPILIIVKVCCDHIENLHPLGELLGP